jgi:flagellar motor switch protein FliN
VADLPLDPQELDAIRSAIQQTRPAVAVSIVQPDATAVALIADNRTAERARPAALRLASRWVRHIERQLSCATGIRPTAVVAGAEIVDGATLRGELSHAWLGAVHASSGGAAGEGALIAAGGPMVEVLAARLLGDTSAQEIASRAPSAVSLRLFDPAGLAIAAALTDAWREELGRPVAVGDAGAAERWRHGLSDGDLAIVVTIGLTGPTGTIRLVARPELLVTPAAAVEAVPAPRAAIEEVLGEVPIEVLVELGKARLTMSELRALRPGAVIALDRFVGDPVPVQCGGVVKAHGRAMVSRGAVAVEIVPERGDGSNE